jgi:RimJ/RimL family protein N-acetyltransferase
MHDQPMPELPLRFTTKRLLIRSYQPGDDKWWFAMLERNREHLARSMPEPLLEIDNEELATLHLRSLSETERGHRGYVFAVFRLEDGQFCGEVSAMLINETLRMFEMGYYADEAMQGQGYTSEALRLACHFCFEVLTAHKLILGCDPANIGSCRVAEKAGFIREGLRRQHVIFEDGSIADSALYGLLREDWEANGTGDGGQP